MKYLLTTLLFVLTNLVRSQGIIAIQNGDETTFANTLNEAVANAASGSTIYLPGGIVAMSSSLNINKSIHIVGCGYHPDSTLATGPSIIMNNMVFVAGSSGSSVIGLSMPSNFIEIQTAISDFRISRCLIRYIEFDHNDGGNNVVISENIIKERFNLAGTGQRNFISNFIFEKNIVEGYIAMIEGGIIRNNIFVNQQLGQSGRIFALVCCSDILNNVFFKNTLDPNFSNFATQSDNNILNNNLFTNDQSWFVESQLGSLIQGNIFSHVPTEIFINFPLTTWTTNHNFRLNPSCLGIGAGTDGTDIGIYGTNLPFKDGGIPINPHFRQAVVSPTTDSNGNLQINIKVSAQDN